MTAMRVEVVGTVQVAVVGVPLHMGTRARPCPVGDLNHSRRDQTPARGVGRPRGRQRGEPMGPSIWEHTLEKMGLGWPGWVGVGSAGVGGVYHKAWQAREAFAEGVHECAA